jgi:beta-galactosidase/beta-glucuronidase
LDGPWDFAHDDADRGLAERWYEPRPASAATPDGAGADDPFSRTIEVPFVPESEASGISATGFHPVIWYRRTIELDPVHTDPAQQTGAVEDGSISHLRTLVHLGAVDRVADVWVDGRHAGHHEGGQTAFTVDLTDLLDPGTEHTLVVRAFDDPHDVETPQGKQDWEERPHGIWYERSTGIWRSVWLEQVPAQHVTGMHWAFDMPRAAVDLGITLARRPNGGRGEHIGRGADGVGTTGAAHSRTEVRVSLVHEDELLGSATATALDPRVDLTIGLPALRNTQARDRLLWRPEHPALIDVLLEVLVDGAVIDTATSYLGLRTCGIDRGHFLLNGEPYAVRSVLEQGYWPTSHLTAPTLGAYREEVRLIKDLGFTAARIHQKVEDPRLLFWADRLGLLIWGETGNAYAFSPRAAGTLTAEWTEIVEQVRPHPSVVTWVPINESWGVRDLADSPAQQDLVRALVAYTKALDPTRPVVSNDGYELVGGDILALHDYTMDPDALRSHYDSREAAEATVLGRGPQGRRPVNASEPDLTEGAPLMLTEFGGIAFAAEGTWGYATADDPAEYREKLTALLDAVHASPVLAGFCYTQLTDTLQEANGLLTADREPKLPIEDMRAIIQGR